MQESGHFIYEISISKMKNRRESAWLSVLLALPIFTFEIVTHCVKTSFQPLTSGTLIALLVGVCREAERVKLSGDRRRAPSIRRAPRGKQEKRHARRRADTPPAEGERRCALARSNAWRYCAEVHTMRELLRLWA